MYIFFANITVLQIDKNMRWGATKNFTQNMKSFLQILEILGLIFEPPSGVCPSVEDLVLCDLFRSIDLRELRGPCFSVSVTLDINLWFVGHNIWSFTSLQTIKPSLSRSTLNLLQAVKKRQCASLGHSLSEANSPCTPPSTPHDRRTGWVFPRRISLLSPRSKMCKLYSVSHWHISHESLTTQTLTHTRFILMFFGVRGKTSLVCSSRNF